MGEFLARTTVSRKKEEKYEIFALFENLDFVQALRKCDICLSENLKFDF